MGKKLLSWHPSTWLGQLTSCHYMCVFGTMLKENLTKPYSRKANLWKRKMQACTFNKDRCWQDKQMTNIPAQIEDTTCKSFPRIFITCWNIFYAKQVEKFINTGFLLHICYAYAYQSVSAFWRSDRLRFGGMVSVHHKSCTCLHVSHA